MYTSAYLPNMSRTMVLSHDAGAYDIVRAAKNGCHQPAEMPAARLHGHEDVAQEPGCRCYVLLLLLSLHAATGKLPWML